MKKFMQLLTTYEQLIAKALELEGSLSLKELYANKHKIAEAREKLIEHVMFLQMDTQEAASRACRDFEPQGPQEWVEGFKAAQVILCNRIDKLNDQ